MVESQIPTNQGATGNELRTKASTCKSATASLRRSPRAQRDAALAEISRGLRAHVPLILESNLRDVVAAREANLSTAMIDRLTLTEGRIGGIAAALEELIELPDPLGVVLDSWTRPNGLLIEKVRVPLGVIGIIYEARPNVTVDAAAIGIKSGNGVVLRGSRSTLATNIVLVSLMQDALEAVNLPRSSIELIADPSPSAAREMMELHGVIDVLVPRGGARLIQEVRRNARIPVLETGEGNCHLYIHQSANPTMAVSIALNAKTSRPSVCNAIETVVIDEAWAERHLGELLAALHEASVECRGCERTQEIAGRLRGGGDHPWVIPASEEDYATEFLDLRVAVRIVSGLAEAIEHIARYTTHHSEAIVSEDSAAAEVFLSAIDAAAVYHNASTRFTDGGEFGFGAELGISTQKLHARGPLGLPELCSYTYRIRGAGQIR
jgi:glutamate-5-semialdehyde dehydrogenase